MKAPALPASALLLSIALASMLLPSTPAHAEDDGMRIEGENARYLFDLAADGSNPSQNPDKVDFLGGCFFGLKGATLSLLFCEFSEGRIHQPERLLQVVQPYLAFAPYPEASDPESGVEGRALGIEYECERTRVRSRSGLRVLKYSCTLKDHFFRRREPRSSPAPSK